MTTAIGPQEASTGSIEDRRGHENRDVTPGNSYTMTPRDPKVAAQANLYQEIRHTAFRSVGMYRMDAARPHPREQVATTDYPVAIIGVLPSRWMPAASR